jgi:heat shock protein HslJ
MNPALRLLFTPLTVALLMASLPLQEARAHADKKDLKVVAQETTSPARKSANITVDGVIRLVNVEGGCYRLQANTGQSYELLGEFPRKDGLRVQVVGELLQDRATICQVGQPLQVKSVKVIQSNPLQRALEISIFGIGPAVDAKAVEAVRSVIGEAVAEGVVDTFITYGYGIEGGSSSCIQLSRFQDPKQLRPLKNELLQIKPNPKTTSYNVKAVAACAQQSSNSVQMSEHLADTEWLLEKLGDTNVIGRPQNLTLGFVSTDRIRGQGGCNSYSAKSQIEGDQLKVETLISTKKACVDPKLQDQENRYFRALESAQRVSLEGSDLLIYSEGLSGPLRFSRLTPNRQQER